jgi:exopolysaccharide biosynthesis polyprenyl glycosylphosphotransferase
VTTPRPSGEQRRSGPFELSRSATPIRLMLQQRGPRSLRRHVLRAVSRILLLLATDVGAFWVMRGIIRLLRDEQVYGASIANALQAVFPRGMLGGLHFGVALIVGLVIAGAYGRGDARRDLSRIATGASFAVLLSLWGPFWESNSMLVLGQGILALALMWSFLSVARLTFDAFIKTVFQTPADGDPMIFVGDRSSAEAADVHERLLGRQRSRHTLWVHVPPRGAADALTPAKAVERLHDALSADDSDTVVMVGEYDPEVFEAIVECATSAGVRVLSAPRVSGVVQERSGVVWYSGAAFVELTVPGLRGSQLIIKRAIDITASFFGLLLLSPVFALVAVAIKLDSRGPVFFSQERVGYAGNVFRVLKFRTMRADADALKESLAHLNASGDPRLFKIPEDPRITGLGRFLRKWSIDELPQLLNVLSGEMSLVGPRPFFESDLKSYRDHHFARLGAKPGITGLWQVKGRSSVVDFEEVVRLDREYIDRWSVALDFWILLMTVPAVLRGRGAY